MTSHVLAPLLERAVSDPDALLLCWVDRRGRELDRLTAGGAGMAMSAVAEGLREQGGRSGDRVLLVYPPGIDFVVAFGGCLLAGVLPVPVYPPKPHSEEDQRRVETFARAAGASIVLTTRRIRWQQRAGAGLLLLKGERSARDLTWWEPDCRARAPLVEVPRVRTEEPAFLQFTSGSTASPKGVILTHGNLVHQLTLSRDHLDLGREARSVAWVPQYHDLGLISGILSCLWRGGPLWMMHPMAFLRDPGAWFDLAHRVRATHTAAPNFAFDLVVQRTSPERRAGWDLSSLQVVMSAAEPVLPRTVQSFLDAFAPAGLSPRAFCPAYGLAEHTVGVTLWGRGRLRLDRRSLEQDGVAVPLAHGDLEICACGAPVGDVEVRIVQDGLVLPEGQVGEIWVDSPSKAAGYWGRPDLTEEAFGGQVEGRLWLRTGDLGFFWEGQLYVSGRLKDVVIVRGRTVPAEEVEEALRDADDRIRRGGIAAFPLRPPDGEERIGVVVEVKDPRADLADVAQRLLHRCQRTWSQPTTLVLVPPRSVRKTTSGKVRRRSTRAALRVSVTHGSARTLTATA